MLLAPMVSAFHPFAYNYAIKLFLDVMVSDQQLTYQSVLTPILLFMVAQLMVDVVWRLADVAEWRSEPYVHRSILLKSFDYVQHHAYSFFKTI